MNSKAIAKAIANYHAAVEPAAVRKVVRTGKRSGVGQVLTAYAVRESALENLIADLRRAWIGAVPSTRKSAPVALISTYMNADLKDTLAQIRREYVEV